MIKVAIRWIRAVSDAVLFTQSGKIISALAAHTTEFPSPDPTVLALTGLQTTFKTAINNDDGSPGGTAATRVARLPLEDGVRKEAGYVEDVANAANGGLGDVSLVYLAEFEPHKEPQPAGILGPPANLRVKQGQLSGTLDCRAQGDPNAGSYEWRYTVSTAPNTYISGGITTSPRITLKALTPGTTISVQVRAIGAAGPSDWSDVAVLMVI
jgi:hypothetical protein